MDFEEFRPIKGFPNYAVSNRGRVFNIRLNREMTLSPTEYGELTVGLMRNSRQHRRSVKKLVARAFVPGETYLFDTPILLDGDRENLAADNIAWRPRWHAWAYIRQFENIPHWAYAGPVYDVKTRHRYDSIIELGILTGSLWVDIRESISRGTRVFPRGSVYTFK